MNNILSVEERVEIIKGMNDKILETGDEEILYDWFTYGVPDNPTEEDFVFIGKDLDLFREVATVFCKIYKNFIKSA